MPTKREKVRHNSTMLGVVMMEGKKNGMPLIDNVTIKIY
jgi:hypothetical protein